MYKFIPFLSITVLVGFLFACNTKAPLSFEEISFSQAPGSALPSFSYSNNRLFLTWTTEANRGEGTIYQAEISQEKVLEPQTIISDTAWFINWADFPGAYVHSKNDQQRLIYFLKKSNPATFSYDIKFISSKNGGKSWTSPTKLHQDTIQGEHGFVSVMDAGDRIGLVWLDGRNASGGHSEHGGAMSLRYGEVDIEGNVVTEQLLDDRVCDCCQTSVTATSYGAFAVYRNRSEDEIRDIWMVRQENGKWLEPEPFSDDQWHIEGCPVNGPSIGKNGKIASVAWFTGATESGEVWLKISSDEGKTFGEKIRVDHGDALGRVHSLVSDQGNIVVSWMETSEEKTYLKIKVFQKSGELLEEATINEMSSGRSSGFPRISLFQNTLYAVWTDPENTQLKLKSASFSY